MPVLVTSKFDEDPIKNERASLQTQFFHYESKGIFRRSRAPNSEWSRPNFRHASLPESLTKFGSN